jgi:hypothetical protein
MAVIPASRRLDFKLASQSFGHSELQLASEAEVSQVCPDCSGETSWGTEQARRSAPPARPRTRAAGSDRNRWFRDSQGFGLCQSYCI